MGNGYVSGGMFSGAGGLDLGLEQAGFAHAFATDHAATAVATLRTNRPGWHVDQADARTWDPPAGPAPDILAGGPPCQGVSLGGLRDPNDPRNGLYAQMVRVAAEIRPRVVVVENVLNLRAVAHPGTGRPLSAQIAAELAGLGYDVHAATFRMSRHGVPQTRRRFILVAFAGRAPDGYRLPADDPADTPAGPALTGLDGLDDHDPAWGWASTVHTATGVPPGPGEQPVLARMSRTASDGHPLRALDRPVPAVDTATVWGWAHGDAHAARIAGPSGQPLWRVTAGRLRALTVREYARLQTFPDDWTFKGTPTDRRRQVGNAVPPEFARRLGLNLTAALTALDGGAAFPDARDQHALF